MGFALSLLIGWLLLAEWLPCEIPFVSGKGKPQTMLVKRICLHTYIWFWFFIAYCVCVPMAKQVLSISWIDCNVKAYMLQQQRRQHTQVTKQPQFSPFSCFSMFDSRSTIFSSRSISSARASTKSKKFFSFYCCSFCFLFICLTLQKLSVHLILAEYKFNDKSHGIKSTTTHTHTHYTQANYRGIIKGKFLHEIINNNHKFVNGVINSVLHVVLTTNRFGVLHRNGMEWLCRTPKTKPQWAHSPLHSFGFSQRQAERCGKSKNRKSGHIDMFEIVGQQFENCK